MDDTLATSGQPVEILLVEDNEDDALLTQRGFSQSRYPTNVRHVMNGKECMAYLRKEGQYANVPTPDLLLLDLNMPIMNGREVLEEIIADEKLQHLPVVILTTSNDEKDVLTMYKLRCSSYIVKPIDFFQFARVVRIFTDYWFTVTLLPRK